MNPKEKTDANTLRISLLKEIRDLEWLIEILDNFSVNIMGCNLLQEKILIVRGEACVGKSQFLVTAAKQFNAEGHYAILLLGNGFWGTESVTPQIMQQLDADFNFQVLLHKLEMLGKLESCNTYILIDAINESPYREIWKAGLPLLIAQIREFEHIKLVVSVRSGYERLVFSETVNEECFVDIFSVVTDKIDQNDLSDRYIKSFLRRKTTAIDCTAFISFVRKEYLERFLSETELKLFWLCMGEKQFFLGGSNQIWNQESALDFTLPSQVREFFLLTAGINVSTGVILSLSGMFDLTIYGERYCVLGEFWKEADGDQFLLRPGEETIWYYAHEQDKVKRLCNNMTELLEKKLARYLNEH